MSLETYLRKRDLTRSTEPGSRGEKSPKGLRFVVHKHAASHLHYDFRLELDGVLKSWAVPKGPSLDPSVKRLAMMVEDHPYEYGAFEGVIPPGNYGAGEVIVWDAGLYHARDAEDPDLSEELLRDGLGRGDLKFVLNGEKLNGEFALVRMKSEKENTWLLIKKQDRFATSAEVTLQDKSVLSGLTIEDLEKGVVPPSREPAAPTERAKAGGPASHDAPFPHQVTPMFASSAPEPFDDPDWIFEIKLDGYRAIAEIEGGEVRLYSRNNLSFNARFPSVVASLSKIRADAVLDGEVVALDENGRSYFQLLQNAQRTGQGSIAYFVFDILYLDGEDLTRQPLIGRKEILRDLLPDLPDVRYSDHIAENGKEFFELARLNNLEGILAKRANSGYQPGRRTREWLKIKIRLQQEAVICGYTEGRGGRKGFGALVLGVYENDELVYIGLTGGGFDDAGLKETYAALTPLVQQECPFPEPVKTGMPVTWVRPELVCEVEFSEWTDENVMRQPIFLGMREDKDPRSVLREMFPAQVQPGNEPAPAVEGTAAPPRVPAGADKGERLARKGDEFAFIEGRRLTLTNLDKVFWPEEGYTKRDVIDYYRKVAHVMLPYLKDRPESLYRTPNGITGEGFYQKEAGEFPPSWVLTREIYSKHVGKHIKFLVCQDEATLVYMANLGCIEINPWLSRLRQLDYPDYLVIDLDPEDIPFAKVVDTARAVRDLLEEAGAPSFPKTSGATGIHIYVPLGAQYDYDQAAGFAKVVATLAHHRVPGFTSILRSPKLRQQRVYLDFLQNRPGQTLAAPYSIRPRPGATVSTPLRWEEVKPGLDPRQFTIENVPSRLEEVGDLFDGVLGPGIDMEQCLENLER